MVDKPNTFTPLPITTDPAKGTLPVTLYMSKSACVKPFSSVVGSNPKATLAFNDEPEFVIVKVRLILLLAQPIALLVPVLRNTVVDPGALTGSIFNPIPPKLSGDAVANGRVVCTLPNTYVVGVSVILPVAFKITLLLPVVKMPEVQVKVPLAPMVIFPDDNVSPAVFESSTL